MNVQGTSQAGSGDDSNEAAAAGTGTLGKDPSGRGSARGERTGGRRKRSWHINFWSVNPDGGALTAAQRHYDSFVRVPIYVLALVWIVSVIFRAAPGLRSEYGDAGWHMSNFVTVMFLLDLVVRFIIDPDKRHFLKRTWPLVVCIVVPFLRIVLVLNAIRAIRRDRNALTKTVFLYAVYGVLFVITVGGAFVLAYEINGPGSIHSYGDSVWWSLETVTTVGYGDFTPVTPQGRLIAAVIMFSGAAAVGSLTAAVASRFIAGGQVAPDVPAQATGAATQSATDSPESASEVPSRGVTSGTPEEVSSTPVVTPDPHDELRQSIEALTAKIDELSRRLEGEGE